jgi:hypothetical protein
MPEQVKSWNDRKPEQLRSQNDWNVCCSIILMSLTVNVRVVHMAWQAQDITILMQANPLLGSLEGLGPENLDFFGP